MLITVHRVKETNKHDPSQEDDIYPTVYPDIFILPAKVLLEERSGNPHTFAYRDTVYNTL